MPKPIFYFAYGSNMSLERLRDRVPQARLIGSAKVENQRLVFNKIGADGSGKANLEPYIDYPTPIVYGALFLIPKRAIRILDLFEGGYDRIEIDVELSNGMKVTAWYYRAKGRSVDDKNKIKPNHWYLEHCIRGAAERRFPKAYVRKMLAVKGIHDRNTNRRRQELSIYGRHPFSWIKSRYA